MAKALVHIGTEKTGTSQIQRFLSDNADLLAQHGLRYPAFLEQLNQTKLVVGFTRGHQDIHRQFGLVDEATTAAYLRHLATDLDAQLPPGSAQRWVFSSEHLSSRFRSQQNVIDFRDWMSRWFDEFEVLVYLRRQDFMASSAYSTFVRSGGAKKWDIEDLTATYFDLAGMVARWTQAFGAERVTVRPYLESMATDGSLIGDFLASAGLPLRAGWIAPQELTNQRLSEDAVEILRMINQAIKSGAARPVLDRSHLVSALADLTPGPGWQFPASALHELVDYYKDANERLVEEVGDNDPRWYEWLDQEPVGGPDEPPAMRTEDVAAVLVGLAQDSLLVAADDPRLRTIGAKVDRIRQRATKRMRRKTASTRSRPAKADQ